MVKPRVYYSAAFFRSVLLTMLGVICGLYVLDLVLRAIVVALFMTGIGVVLILVPVILPVWRASRRFLTHENRPMTRGEGWTFSLIFALLSGLVLALLVAIFAGLGARMAVDIVTMAQEDAFFALKAIGVYGLILVALNRLILWIAEKFGKHLT